MIRTQSVIMTLAPPKGVKNAVPTQIVVSIGWNDPHKALLRTKLNMHLSGAMERFRQRMQLLQGKFDLEDLCKFMQNDKELEADKVHVMDGTNGAGCEWTKFPLPIPAPVENVQ